MKENTYVCTIKKSLKRSTWQIKDAVSHEVVLLHGFARQLDAAVLSLGGDPLDPNIVWDFFYTKDQRSSATFRLELVEDRGGRVVYRVAEGLEPTLGTEGWLPNQIFAPWGGPLAAVSVRIAPTLASRPFFLSPAEFDELSIQGGL